MAATTRVYAPTGWRTLEAAGIAIANSAFAQADDASFSLATHGDNYPHLEMELTWTHGTAPTANSTLAVYAQDIGVNGVDARPPSANNLQKRVAVATVDAVITAQASRFDIIKAPTSAWYWLQGVGITNAVTAGWVLRVRAFTFNG